MTERIRIHAGAVSMTAELNDSPTACAIHAALPLEASAQTWGDEIYFRIPVEQKLDGTALEVVAVGDLGYWPTGRAFCIFFGPTPASRGDEIRPASAVNLVGKVVGDAKAFRAVQDGDLVRLERDS
jgi:uncharacterized protein